MADNANGKNRFPLKKRKKPVVSSNGASEPPPNRARHGEKKELISIPLADIAESPLHLSIKFGKQTMHHLAENMKIYGLRKEFSVREDPHRPGKYILNRGLKYYRAAVMAKVEKATVYVENDYDPRFVT